MSSSSSNNSQSSNDSDYSHESCVIQKFAIIKPRCRFLIKGGDIDDNGATYNIPFDCPFHYVYADYARKAGVTVRDVRLRYHMQFINPENTPFSMEFVGNEIVLAYGEDQQTPMPVKLNNPGSKELLVFNIIDMMDAPIKERLVRGRNYKLSQLYQEWGGRRDVDGGDVTFFLKGQPLDHFIDQASISLVQAGIFDGALLYARYTRFD